MKRLSKKAYKNLTPYVVANPQGADVPAVALQDAMADVLDKSFGRVITRSKMSEGANIIYPAVFVGEGYDYLNLLANDNFDSYSFIKINDPQTFNTDDRNEDALRVFNIDVIAWLNLARVDSSKDYDFSPEVIEASLTAIRNADLFGVTVEGIYTTPSEVFTGYSLETSKTQHVYYPNSVFRINLEVLTEAPC